jgi:hypothetical protein
MTLEESSLAALEAARSGDLDALAGALTARLLRDLIRETGLENARLRQLERYK